MEGSVMNLHWRAPAGLHTSLLRLPDLLLGGCARGSGGCFGGHVCSFLSDQVRLSASWMARTKSSGASCGRLWPMPPVSVRCAYLPVNRAA